MRFLKLLFLTLILISAIFLFFFWRNQYSKESLKIDILGPEKVNFGEEVEYTVQIKNNGNFRLEEGELTFKVPPDCTLLGTLGERATIKLDEPLYPGDAKTFTFKVKMFGKENEKKTLSASFTFRPKNIKAYYTNSTSFTAMIASIPFTLEMYLPSQIPPQKEFPLKIYYFSSLNSVLTNLRIQLEVPAGRFEFLSSNLPAIDSKEWHIFALNQYEGGTIEIKGKAFGEVGENIVFKARVGIIKDGQYIVMKEIEKLARLIKPSIYIRQEINGHPEYVASPGDWLHYEIYFKNVGEEDLKSLILIANLEGDYFDFSTLQAPSGHFQPGEHSIIFDWKDNMDLQLLPPMKEGKVEFWIRLKSDILEIKEPTIKSKIFIGETKEEFVNKIAPKLIFSQSGYFEDEVFGNSGPLPPKVGQPTTYTIIWRLNSGASSFKDVKVTAFLPFNVSLTGKIFPETEISKFSFDSNTREIMWAAGEVQGEKTIAFQIKLVPNESDKGKMPTLIEKSQVLAQDPWTEKEIKIEAEPINTFLKTDFTITQDKAIVN